MVIVLLAAAGAAVVLSLCLNVAVYGEAQRDAVAAPRRRGAGASFISPPFFAECCAGIATLATAFPTRAVIEAPPGSRRGTVVLLRSTLVPRGALRVLRRRLRAAGWRTIAARARFDGSLAAADDARLKRALDTLRDDGGALALLGHGTGGLLARACAARHAHGRALRVVTLATPHQGTRCSLTRAALRPGSPLLAELARIDPSPHAFDAIALYSDFDPWVRPHDDAYYPGAFNIEVRNVGHLSMLFSRRVADLVLENLAAPSPGA